LKRKWAPMASVHFIDTQITYAVVVVIIYRAGEMARCFSSGSYYASVVVVVDAGVAIATNRH